MDGNALEELIEGVAKVLQQMELEEAVAMDEYGSDTNVQ